MNFRSDNEAPVAPEILAALMEANSETALAYGADELTLKLDERFSEVFETAVNVFPVVTGTAANGLALASIIPPYGAVICHDDAHIHRWEAAGTEFFSGGAKLLPLSGENGKLLLSEVSSLVEKYNPDDQHQVLISALSVTQASEWGTVYKIDELSELSEFAHIHGCRVHMDGARFANAISYLRCSPAAMTWKAGVDVLSFGATKNGAMCADAVIFFNATPELRRSFIRRRKRVGHEWSKMRFISAQLLAYVDNDLWLGLASRANQSASVVAQSLEQSGCARLKYPVQANEIFVSCSSEFATYLKSRDVHVHPWPDAVMSADEVGLRLVTSYAMDKKTLSQFSKVCMDFKSSR